MNRKATGTLTNRLTFLVTAPTGTMNMYLTVGLKMATLEQIVPTNILQLADFKTFGQAIGTALSSFGWTKDYLCQRYSGLEHRHADAVPKQQSFPSLTTITFRGAYSNAGVTYNVNDTVTFNGMTWVNQTSYTSSASTATPGNELAPGGAR